MTTFRQLLALSMLLTALALAWLSGGQAGVDGMISGLAIASITAVFLWWLGDRRRRGWERNGCFSPPQRRWQAC